MEKFEFTPTGVCCRKMVFEVEGDTVANVVITGGCAGNLLGISQMLKGKNYQEVIDVFKGIRCGSKSTSCPDQIAVALSTHFQK